MKVFIAKDKDVSTHETDAIDISTKHFNIRIRITGVLIFKVDRKKNSRKLEQDIPLDLV